MRMEEALEEDPDTTMDPLLDVFQPQKDDRPSLLYMRRQAYTPPSQQDKEGSNDNGSDEIGNRESEDDGENPDDCKADTFDGKEKKGKELDKQKWFYEGEEDDRYDDP
jgi:hypothetical protein